MLSKLLPDEQVSVNMCLVHFTFIHDFKCSHLFHYQYHLVGPLAIIGGTASIYSAALSHSSSTLTPLSVVYLFLLALNYSIMPRISKKCVHPKANKKSLALVEEMVKLSMGIGGFLITDNLSSIKNWTLQSSLIAAGLPSALYAIQGVFTYTAYQNLDSVTFNGLTQMKTLSAALCCYLVLGKVQSSTQLIALALLSITPWVFEGKFTKILTRNQNEVKNVAVNDVDLKKRFVWGIVPCLGATLLSGLAGAFSQKSLQMVVGSMERNAYFYSAEISLCTAVCLFGSMGLERLQLKRGTGAIETIKENPAGIKKAGYFDYWSWKTFIPITVKATGGILTALVHKQSGSVMKGFSLVLGLVISALLQTILDGEDLTMSQIFGTALILLSSWLHFTSPP
jgi:UDP-sugar transporter A1/2/3